MILALPALQAAAEAPGLGGASASGHEIGLGTEPSLTWNRVPPPEQLQQHEDLVQAHADLAAQAKWPGAPPSQDRGALACVCCLVVAVAGC